MTGELGDIEDNMTLMNDRLAATPQEASELVRADRGRSHGQMRRRDPLGVLTQPCLLPHRVLLRQITAQLPTAPQNIENLPVLNLLSSLSPASGRPSLMKLGAGTAAK